MNYDKLIKALVSQNAVRATMFISPKQVVRVVRKRYKHDGKFDKRSIEIVLTNGKPNYLEREFIKTCVKAGEKFPIKKIQFKYLPSKKKSVSKVDNGNKR